MLGEAAFGGVEDQVEFVDARGDRLGAEFGEETEKGFGGGNAELDFGFARHEEIVSGRDIRYQMSDRRYYISDIGYQEEKMRTSRAGGGRQDTRGGEKEEFTAEVIEGR